jgi:hypothetical protein
MTEIVVIVVALSFRFAPAKFDHAHAFTMAATAKAPT